MSGKDLQLVYVAIGTRGTGHEHLFVILLVARAKYYTELQV